MWRKLLYALPAFALALLTGCGAGGGTVAGQVNFGANKPAAEDKISLSISDGKNNFSSEVDESGNFKFTNVPDGSYVLTVTFYKAAPVGEPKPGKPTGPGQPVMKTYPDNFKVPGGPYTVEMDRIAPAKK